MILHSGSKHSREAGFTLIESIMVIVLIAILSAVVFLRNPFDTIKLNNAAKKVIGDIRYAQKLAISNQTRAGINFSGSGYDVHTDVTNLAVYAKTSGDACSDDGTGNFRVNFTTPQCSNYQNITITTLPTTNPIAFNSLGTPVNSGGVVLVGNQFVDVTYNGTKRITIEAGTGRVF